ncbi:hypothetical protein ABPG72_005898 [Tetrahymena utriculariae]
MICFTEEDFIQMMVILLSLLFLAEYYLFDKNRKNILIECISYGAMFAIFILNVMNVICAMAQTQQAQGYMTPFYRQNGASTSFALQCYKMIFLVQRLLMGQNYQNNDSVGIAKFPAPTKLVPSFDHFQWSQPPQQQD